jgi:hypothetical protein
MRDDNVTKVTSQRFMTANAAVTRVAPSKLGATRAGMTRRKALAMMLTLCSAIL